MVLDKDSQHETDLRLSRRYKFTTKFKNSVKDVMSELGLNEIKTKRQKAGTMLFLDPETESIYGLYESGYCRRFSSRRFCHNIG